jgi:hypothetical protein
MSIAELRLTKGGLEVARANYHLRGKGGLSLNKWASTKSKMDPVIDELLAQYEYDPDATHTVVDFSTDVAEASAESDKPTDVYAELIKLDDLRERGILTQEEFDAEKKKLLESH